MDVLQPPIRYCAAATWPEVHGRTRTVRLGYMKVSQEELESQKIMVTIQVLENAIIGQGTNTVRHGRRASEVELQHL